MEQSKDALERQRQLLKASAKQFRKAVKHHKLYVRSKEGSLRRLDKLSIKIYNRVIQGFTTENFGMRSKELNENRAADDRRGFLPISVSTKDESDSSKDIRYSFKHAVQQLHLPAAKSMVIFYQDVSTPLVVLHDEK